MWILDRLAKHHSYVMNICTHPIVAVFGKDGRKDDEEKCYIKLMPGEGSKTPHGYHLDWLIRQDCYVIECKTRFQSCWKVISFEGFCRKIHSDRKLGKNIILRIREAFGEDAPPPCGKRGANANA